MKYSLDACMAQGHHEGAFLQQEFVLWQDTLSDQLQWFISYLETDSHVDLNCYLLRE